MFHRVASALLILNVLAVAEPLRSLAEIRSLPSEQAARHLPVEIEGTVTYFDANAENYGESEGLVLRDGTAGCYASSAVPFKERERILPGITDIGDYARHFNGPKADGIAFSQTYANQLCSPKRAAIMTGHIASCLGVTTATATTNLPFKGGKWCNAVTDCTDFLPTVAQLTGNPAPEKIDGRSMMPLLENPGSPGPGRTLIWHYPFNVSVKHPDFGTPLPPHSGIRVGDHKLIWNWHGRLELYNIATDSQEKHDLSNEKPALVTQLHQQLKNWLKENVAPRYWPKRDKTVSPEDAGGPFPFRDLR